MRVMASPAFKGRNPFTWLLYSHLRELGCEVVEFSRSTLVAGARVQVWHVHWPEGVLKSPFGPKAVAKLLAFAVLLQCARLRGTRIVWTVHNLGAHEAHHPRLERLFWRLFIPAVDGYIVFNDAARRLALETFPRLARVPGFVIPHGHYRGFYPDDVTRDAARRHLGLPPTAKVVLFIGQIRPYKNVTALIRAVRAVPDPDVMLVLAGEPRSAALREEIERALQADPRLRGSLRFIPPEDIQYYLRAADLTVLPYREILNSGAALLTLSFDCPVLVPEKGALRGLRAEVGADWIRLFRGELGPTVLADALRWAGQRRARQPDLTAYDWAGIAQAALRAYETVVHARERTVGPVEAPR